MAWAKSFMGWDTRTRILYIAARLVSALLGAMSGVLIYYLARTIGANMLISALAGLLYIASGIAAANSRFAHNDLYLQFFSVLCVYFAIKYQLTKCKIMDLRFILCGGTCRLQ